MTARASRNRGAGVVVRGKFRRRRPPSIHPHAFQDWRSPVDVGDDHRRQSLSRDLMPIAILHEPRWTSAVAGDPGAAIGIALERLWMSPLRDIRRDLILSALWGCATAGDPASKLLLAVMRERVDRPECA